MTSNHTTAQEAQDRTGVAGLSHTRARAHESNMEAHGLSRATCSNGLADRVAAMPPEAQAAAFMVLDELTRPLTVREIERALMRHGVPKSRAIIIASAVRKLAIVAIVGGEAR